MNKQELKLGARILENLPIMSPDVMQGWIDNPKSLKQFLSGLVPEEAEKPYLRHLETITLASTKGKLTLAKIRKVFTCFHDSDFRDWSANVSDEDTNDTFVDVYEVARDGNFRTLFGSLGDPYKLILTQGQIVQFCRSHRDSLRKEGFGTLFLFEVNGELFVIQVKVLGGELEADHVRRFDNALIWLATARPRLVVKQQTT